MTQEFYDRAVAIAEFEGHCAQRRKYPVLLKLEFNSAIRDKEMVHSVRNGTVRCNQEKNQNPRILPCEYQSIPMFSERETDVTIKLITFARTYTANGIYHEARIM